MNNSNNTKNINNTNSPGMTQTFKTLKRKYRRACYILQKIEKNKEYGKINDHDYNGEIQCHKIVEEYESYINSKRNTANDQPAGPTLTRPNNIVISENDDFSLALVNEDFSKNKIVTALWQEIECKLSSLVIDYILNNTDGPIPCYDSSKLFRGCRLIKCMDNFSKIFIIDCVNKICNSWEGLKLKLIPAKDVPRRPCARIWLPKISSLTNKRLLMCLKLHNPLIPIDDWYIIRKDTSKNDNNNMCYIIQITEESVEALKKVNNKLSFGIRNTQVKIISGNGKSSNYNDERNNDDSNLLDDINDLQITSNNE
ncbi:uncharacterized protein LOC142221177 [Haematobia irritans]|uniref:uncharacterized protein LOC142221177 n=1 Tax=Haematobia irritans TaxID=7368 RepID=UPI003F5067E4